MLKLTKQYLIESKFDVEILDKKLSPEHEAKARKTHSNLKDIKMQSKYANLLVRSAHQLEDPTIDARTIHYFDEKILPNLPADQRDINKHDYMTIQKHVMDRQSVGNEREQDVQLRRKAIVFEDDNHIIFNPTNREEAVSCGIVHGKNAWCISHKDRDANKGHEFDTNHWNSYIGTKKQFHHVYFVVDKTKKPDTPLSKFALLINKKNLAKSKAWNASDSQLFSYKSLGVHLPEHITQAISDHYQKTYRS